MWDYNAPPVAAPSSLEDDDELSSSSEGFTDYTSSLFDMQQHLDPSPAYTFTTTTTTNQPYQYDSNLMHHVDGGSPSHELPRTPVLTPPPPYAVPSPNSLPSPTNQEPPPQPFAPYMMQDIKPPPFLHLKEKNKKQADIEQWEEYTNPSKAYSELYDCNNRLVSKDVAIRTRITADNLEYSHVDDAHIMYRQNQFSLEVDFFGDLARYSSNGDEAFHVLKWTSSGSSVVPVVGLYFYIYSVKHQRGQPFDQDLVELIQACRSRNNKDYQAPGLCPISNGRAMYSKLQFRAATANNARKSLDQPNPQQQFYRIIIALVAKTADDSIDFICTRISPFLVVRGQNPGRFKPLPPIPNTPPAPLFDPTPVSAPIPPSKSKRTVKVKKQQTQRNNKRPRYEEDEEDYESPVPVPSPDAPIPAPVHTHVPAPAVPVHTHTHASTAPLSALNLPVLTSMPAPMHLPVPLPMPATLTPIEPVQWGTGMSNDIVFVAGKVGINTPTPTEALSVVGNIMLTGDIIKPSDQRVKTNIQPVSTASQLANIEALQIYDYELIHGKGVGRKNDYERGILAQQLQKIIPSATKTVNNVTMADGEVIDELIVVKDRALLFENIGATQELSTIVKKEQEMIQSIDQKFEGRIQEESIAAEKTLTVAGKLLDYILVEKNDEASETLWCVFASGNNKGFYGSVFGLGPANTMYILGFFLPFLWFFGSFFILSHSKAKKRTGFLHLITCVLVTVYL